MSEVTIVHDADGSRYELYADGERAGFIRYRQGPGVRDFVHTEVDERYSGQGLGSRLVAGALDDLPEGTGVIPTCPFVARYLQRHPEYAHLVRAGS